MRGIVWLGMFEVFVWMMIVRCSWGQLVYCSRLWVMCREFPVDTVVIYAWGSLDLFWLLLYFLVGSVVYCRCFGYFQAWIFSGARPSSAFFTCIVRLIFLFSASGISSSFFNASVEEDSLLLPSIDFAAKFWACWILLQLELPQLFHIMSP